MTPKIDFARKLRKQPSDIEQLLWLRLRGHRLLGLGLNWNNEILINMEGVLGDIAKHCG